MASLAKGSLRRTRLGVVERLERNPYAVWDASASYATGRLRPFLQLTNITNADYQELPGIVMPSRAIVGGCEFYVFGGR